MQTLWERKIWYSSVERESMKRPKHHRMEPKASWY